MHDIFCCQNSETARRSQSGHNPDMEVMDSIFGQSVVRAHLIQKILCLDCGGMKVKLIPCFFARCMNSFLLSKKYVWPYEVIMSSKSYVNKWLSQKHRWWKQGGRGTRGTYPPPNLQLLKVGIVPPPSKATLQKLVGHINLTWVIWVAPENSLVYRN